MGDDTTDHDRTSTDADEPLGDSGRRALEAERKARRDAEHQAQQLTSRLDRMLQSEAERIASTPAEGYKPLFDGSDMWRHADLAGVLDDEGRVDVGKVRAAAAELAEQKPHLAARPVVNGGADGGRGSGAPAGDADKLAERLMRGG